MQSNSSQASPLEPLSKLFVVGREAISGIIGEGRRTFCGALTAFLQDGQQCGPSRRVQELETIREVMRRGDAAEESFFFLYYGRYVSDTI